MDCKGSEEATPASQAPGLEVTRGISAHRPRPGRLHRPPAAGAAGKRTPIPAADAATESGSRSSRVTGCLHAASGQTAPNRHPRAPPPRGEGAGRRALPAAAVTVLNMRLLGLQARSGVIGHSGPRGRGDEPLSVCLFSVHGSFATDAPQSLCFHSTSRISLSDLQAL